MDLKKSSKISEIVTNKKNTLAVRFPKHPVTRNLLKMLDFPLAAPSANPSSKVSAVSSNDVKDDFGKKVKYVLDGGKSSRWLSVLLLKDYNIHDIEYLISKLYKNNIEVRPIWKPMHLQPIFKNSVFISKNKFKGFSYQLFNKGLCLPSGSNLNQKDQDRIINIIKNFLK